MTPAITSIFDLSPSEKLQLVEDLWDDLAVTPEMVPVHGWQKEELARRKANLTENSASGLMWEEVKRRVRSRYGRYAEDTVTVYGVFHTSCDPDKWRQRLP